MVALVRATKVVDARTSSIGEMAERFKAPVLKTGEGSNLPWVRIPLSPPVRDRKPLNLKVFLGDPLFLFRVFFRVSIALRAVALPCAPFGDMAAFTWFAREVARQTQPDRIGAGHDADNDHAALRLPGERRTVPRASRW